MSNGTKSYLQQLKYNQAVGNEESRELSRKEEKENVFQGDTSYNPPVAKPGVSIEGPNHGGSSEKRHGLQEHENGTPAISSATQSTFSPTNRLEQLLQEYNHSFQ